jgi:hypothetical protein
MPQGTLNMPQIGRSVTHTIQAKNIIADDIWSNSINMKRSEIEIQRVDESEINYLKVKKQAEICDNRTEDDNAILIVNNTAFVKGVEDEKKAIDVKNGNFIVRNGRTEMTNCSETHPTLCLTNEYGTGSCALTIKKGDFCFEQGNLVLQEGDTIIQDGNVIIENGYISVTYGTTGGIAVPLILNNIYGDTAINIIKGDIYNDFGDLILNEGNITINHGGVTMQNGDITINVGDINVDLGDIHVSEGDIIVDDGNITICDGDLILKNGSIGVTANNPTDVAINIYEGNINIGGRQINNIELNGVKNCPLIKSSLGEMGMTGVPLYDISIYGLGNNMYIRNITSAQGGETGHSDQKYSFMNRIGFKSNPQGPLGTTGLNLNLYKSIKTQLFKFGQNDAPELVYTNQTDYTEIPICIQDLTNNEYAIQYNFSVDNILIDGCTVGLIFWELVPHDWSGATTIQLTQNAGNTSNIVFSDDFMNGYNRLSYVRMNYDAGSTSYNNISDILLTSINGFENYLADTSHVNRMEFNNNHRQVRVSITLYTGQKNNANVVPDKDLCDIDKWIDLSYVYDTFIEADISNINYSDRIRSKFFVS